MNIWGGLIFLWLCLTCVSMCKPQRDDDEVQLDEELPASPTADIASSTEDVKKEKIQEKKFFPSSHPIWSMPISIGRRRRRDAQ